MPTHVVTIHLAAALLLLTGTARAEGPLPTGAARPAVKFDYFPDRMHAVVFRNWQLVEPERIAKVLGTSADKVTAIATAMGLPPAGAIPPEMKARGYITVLRRNWHLLPYDQLLIMLDMSAEELAFRLREDDFFWSKLGGFKPACDPVHYQESSAAVRERERQIKQVVEKNFGRELFEAGEPRFKFVDRLITTDPARAKALATRDDDGVRFIYSYFGVYGDPLLDTRLDPYPDGLLEKLADQGVNGVWLHVVLRQLAPRGPLFPASGAGYEKRLMNLRRLVERAGRYGIRVYLYMNEPRAMPEAFFKNHPEMAGVTEEGFRALCTSNPTVRQWVRESLEYVFRMVPDLGGVFTITASENLTNCASHGNKKACPRCSKRSVEDILAEINTTIEQGVHRGNPKAKVLMWDWQWEMMSGTDPAKLIAKLPKSGWLMSVSEWSLPIERGGVKSEVNEYSISSVGPAPRALKHWKLAKEHGLKTVAKVQLNNTWELSTVPYLPTLDLVAEHCANLARIHTDGMMLGWSLGGYPSLNLEIAKRFADDPAADRQQVLDTVAKSHFGAEAALAMRKAWTLFSQAFREYPFNIWLVYFAPHTYGPSNPLYPEKTGYRATMLGFAYDDLANWRSIYPADVYAKQMEKVAGGWRDGIRALEEARSQATAKYVPEVEDQLRIARAAELHFASAANQARFVMARDALAGGQASPEKSAQLRSQLVGLADAETQNALQLYRLTKQDSRIGFEASNHYYYVPLDLVEKVINCDYVRQKFAQRR